MAQTTAQSTAEQSLAWTEAELHKSYSRVEALEVALSQSRATTLRLELANKRLAQHVDAVSTKDDGPSSTRRGKSPEERRMADLVFRIGNIEEMMKLETDNWHAQLEASCVRLERSIGSLGDRIDLDQRRLREAQTRAFEKIADAVRDFVRPIELALAESVEENIGRGNSEEAQREVQRQEELRRLIQRLLHHLLL